MGNKKWDYEFKIEKSNLENLVDDYREFASFPNSKYPCGINPKSFGNGCFKTIENEGYFERIRQNYDISFEQKRVVETDFPYFEDISKNSKSDLFSKFNVDNFSIANYLKSKGSYILSVKKDQVKSSGLVKPLEVLRLNLVWNKFIGKDEYTVNLSIKPVNNDDYKLIDLFSNNLKFYSKVFSSEGKIFSQHYLTKNI